MKAAKIAVTLGMLNFALTGCFQMKNSSPDSQTSSSTVTDQRNDDEIQTNTKTLAVVGSSHILPHMMSITGLPSVPVDAQTKFIEKKDVYSIKGEIDSINAPMWVAIVDLGGEFCNAVVTAESAAGAKRKFFETVDFTKGPANVTGAIFDSSVEKLSTSFWGRLPNEEERGILKDGYLASFTDAAAKDPKQSLVWLCSAMIASRTTMEF